MNIFVYSDESGVFDYINNDIFVFGGIIFLSKNAKDVCTRKYIAAERTIRESGKIPKHIEIKATSVRNSQKNKLFRSLNQCIKFGVVINQRRLLPRIFNSKKDKQRYLDYAFKIGVKRAFERLIKLRKVDPFDVKRLYFFNDEHTTATNGLYELREGLEQELKNGTYNLEFDIFYPPLFPQLEEVNLRFCCSKIVRMVRAADIVANRYFYEVNKGDIKSLNNATNLITFLP